MTHRLLWAQVEPGALLDEAREVRDLELQLLDRVLRLRLLLAVRLDHLRSGGARAGTHGPVRLRGEGERGGSRAGLLRGRLSGAAEELAFQALSTSACSELMVLWSSSLSLRAVCTLAVFCTTSLLSSRHFLIRRFSLSAVGLEDRPSRQASLASRPPQVD